MAAGSAADFTGAASGASTPALPAVSTQASAPASSASVPASSAQASGFVAFHPGFGFHRRFFHPGFFVNGVWVNSWWGGYGNSCWDYRPVYDAWGNFFGQQYVNLCQY